MLADDDPSAFEATYRECVRLYDERRRTEAAQLAGRFKEQWQAVDGLSFPARKRLAYAMWIACNAAAIESDERTGMISLAAYEGLDELLVWLRRQPEREFRKTEALRLCVRMHWHVWPDEILDSLEQVVAVLADLDDPGVAKDIISLVVDRLSGLFAISDDDQRRFTDGAIEMLTEGGATSVDPDAVGASEAFVARMVRVADALSELGGSLECDDDARATKLRAALLFVELEAVGKLGQEARLEDRFESFAALGDAAVAACDAIVQRGPDHVSVPSTLMMKASVLHSNNDDDAALSVLTEVIDRFGDRDEPGIAAMVAHARELQTDLLDEAADESM